MAALATALTSAFALTLWATRPSFKAKFGPIDDHEPLDWIGPHHHLAWSRFWTTFLDKTEVGQWGSAGRFRPAYYLVRVGQAVLLGDNPRSWYVWVTAVFALTCGLLAYTAATWLTAALDGARPSVRWTIVLIGSAVGSLLFAGLYAWSGIVGRLGPSEQLGLLATGVVLLSLTRLSLGLSRLWWIPALLGVTTAIFAKESFFSLALAFPLVGTYSYVAFGRRRSDLVAGLLGLAPAAGLAAILGPTLLRSQHDVYGGGVGGSRLSGALSSLTDHRTAYGFLAAGVIVLAWIAANSTTSKSESERRASTFLLAVIGWLVACLLLDAWFYGGKYVLPRYRAIPDLVTTIELIGAACLSVVAIRRARRGRTRALVLTATATLASSLSIVLLAHEAASNLRLTRATAALHATTSNEYQRGLSTALAQLARAPEPEFAVVATKGGDYEPAYAVLHEVARRSRNRFREYLIVDSSSYKAEPVLRVLRAASESGSIDWDIRPIEELDRSRGAICVFLNESPHPVAGCRRRGGVGIVAEGM